MSGQGKSLVLTEEDIGQVDTEPSDEASRSREINEPTRKKHSATFPTNGRPAYLNTVSAPLLIDMKDSKVKHD